MATVLLLLALLLSTVASSSPNATSPAPGSEEIIAASQRSPSGGCQDITGKSLRGEEEDPEDNGGVSRRIVGVLQHDLDGWIWQREPCVRCICRQGQIGCLTIKCSQNKSCGAGERNEQKPSECCSRCVRMQGTCRHGGTLHENGTTWTPMHSTDVCKCENGTTACSPAEDERDEELDPNDVLADEPQDSSLTSEAGFLMTVIAGQPDTISTHHLSFNMSEAEDRQIVFIITRKLRAPKEGRLVIVGMHHAEVTSFTQKDLVDKRLVYVPPHSEDVPSEAVFCFPFVVWKYPQRSRLTSEHSFCVKVLPKSKGEMSFTLKNPEFNITKGGSAEITKRHLEVENAGRHLRYIIIEPPLHGSLKLLSKTSSSRDITQGFEFSSSELGENSVLYAHSGMGGVNKDYIEILATDGWGEASNMYIINVAAAAVSSDSNSTKPQPLVILEGEHVRIKSSFLAPTPAVAGRSPHGYYTLSNLPTYGKMILTDEDEGEFPLGVHFAFSSEDVEAGKLLYRAAEEIGLESRTERLAFNFDTGGNDKEQVIHLVISVLPVDDQAPSVAVNGEVVVAEGSSEQLPPSLLTVTDVDTPMHNLHVEIMRQPYFGRIVVDRGDSKPLPVESFSVEEFLKGKVRYDQSYSKRVEPIEDVLLFRVTDGAQSSPLTRLNISIDLQNDEPPKTITHTLHVESGRTKLIDKGILNVEDLDTDPGNILITITQTPTQGALRKRLFQWRPLGSGLHLSTNDTLVYKDILEGLVSYSAVGGFRGKEDHIVFSVTDGKFHDVGKIVVEITYRNGDTNAQPAEIRRPSTAVTSTEKWTPKHTSTTSVRESRSKEAVVVVPPKVATSGKVLPTRPVILFSSHPWTQHAGALKGGGVGPGPGRPLLCVPPCHPRHPMYASTRGICAGTDPDSVRYDWEVSLPVDFRRTSYLPFRPLQESTAFASTKANVLDPLYIPKLSRVLCSAGLPGGVPVKSEYVAVDGPATCGPARGSGRGFFSARLSYVDASSTKDGHGNTLRVELSIPHADGMVPLVSTQPLSDPDLLMTDPMYRAHHFCSNLIPGRGFLAKRGSRSGRWRMYDDLKDGEDSAIRIYEYLDLDECTWHFEAWFTVAELLDECGGKMISDLRGNKEGQRYMKFNVPLYLSYVFSSSPSKWTTMEHKTDMEFSMEYSSLLWKKGIHTRPTMSVRLQMKRISVDDTGRLTVDFTTIALFPGRFALRDVESRPQRHSVVHPPPHLHQSINLTLELLNTDDMGMDGTEQSWKMTSDMSLEDYTGEYMIRLLPCSFNPQSTLRRAFEEHRNQPCTIGPYVEIPMVVNFRQIGKPEPITYSLETEFYLAKRPPLLDSGNDDMVKDMQNTEPADEIYSPGDEVYGLVMWHPSQDLSKAYKLSIQRLYLCSGKEGYIPTYDPTGEIYGKGPQYGCIQPSRNLEHRLLLLDNVRSQNIDRDYHGIPLEVHPASEMTEFKNILNHSGVDGFAMKVDPLYKIKAGNHWYLQVLYSIGPSRRRSKRSSFPGYQKDGHRFNSISSHIEDGFSSYQKELMKPIILGWPISGPQLSEAGSEIGPWKVVGFVLLFLLTVTGLGKFMLNSEPIMKSLFRIIKRLMSATRNTEKSEQVEPLNSDSASESNT